MFKEFWDDSEISGKIILGSCFSIFLLGLILLITFTVSNFIHYPFNFHVQPNLTHNGQFGDFVGGVVGTLWSIIAIILLFSTLTIQSKQMKLQQEEFTRNQELSRDQYFQNNLYSLIIVQRDIKVNLQYIYVNYEN